MKVIIDTNVFISAVFFGGLPYRILNAWRDGRFELVVSPEILEEYKRVGEELSARYKNISVEPVLEFITIHASLVQGAPLEHPVCEDPDDDKFIACALSCGAKVITSGDKHLLAVSGYKGITVLKPRAFAEKYLG